MKTEKQIKIMEEQIGKEHEAKYAKLDRVVVSDTSNFFLNFIGEQLGDIESQSVNFMPIIREGVFITEEKQKTEILYFSVSEDSDTEDVKFHVSYAIKPVPVVEMEPSIWQELEKLKIRNHKKYVEMYQQLLGSKTLWLCDYDVIIRTDKESGECTFDYINFDNAKNRIYQKQGRKYINKDEDTLKYTGIFNRMILTMVWLNYVNKNPELKVVESVSNHAQRSAADIMNQDSTNNVIADSEKSSPIRREIVLNGIKVITTSEKLIKKLSSKKRQYLAEAWSVRGHYRHYKSGKVSYVKPYTKGKKGGPKAQKIYVAN